VTAATRASHPISNLSDTAAAAAAAAACIFFQQSCRHRRNIVLRVTVLVYMPEM